MDARATQSTNGSETACLDSYIDVDRRLEILLETNARIEREKNLYTNDRERTEALTMGRPLTPDAVFSYFGLMLGALPPTAIMYRMFADGLHFEDSWIFILLAAINATTAATGYLLGKPVGLIVSRMENMRWLTMLPALSLTGFLWGAISGAAGGFLFFVIGSLFGAVIGGAVGAVALPAFAALHRLFRSGELLDMKHFLPLAFGVVFVICALIIGFGV